MRLYPMCIAVLLVMSASSVFADLPDYQFVPLNQPGINYSRAWEINDAGVVALEGGGGVGGTIGFTWSEGTFLPLQTIVPAGSNARATVRAINNAGVIVGNSYGPGGLFDQRGVSWSSDGTITDLGRYNNSNTFFRDINESGVIVGGSNRSFRYDSDTGYTELFALNGGTNTSVQAINENGWMVGRSHAEIADGVNQSRATVWKPDGELLNLGILDIPNQEDVISFAQGVNDNNEVVGYFGNALFFSHAFYWSESSGLIDLGAPGGRSSFANDINNSGMIVGRASFTDDPQSRAYLWYDGSAYDLNDFLPVGSGWELAEAYGINEIGDIVGRGSFNGQSQAFLLRVPEPNSLVFLAIAACLLGVRRY